MELGLFLILLVNIGLISAGDWINPAFTKPPNFPCDTIQTYDDQKCENWVFDSGVLQTVYIKFKEEQKDPLLIAEIHCTDCDTDVPVVTSFTDGTELTLGAEIKKESEGIYSLIINNKLDYEIKEHRLFKFSIKLLGAVKDIKVKIDLIDIDDEKPRITVHQTPCEIPENYIGKTNCTYFITDPDTNGLKDIKYIMDDEYKKHFQIVLSSISNNDADATLEVLEPLDFEKMPMYFFELKIEDLGTNQGTALIMITVKDENDMPPTWMEIFAMKTFEEHTTETFTVHARDGDLGILDEIIYSWKDNKECHEKITLTTVGEKAEIRIEEIDRDTQEMEDNDNTIKCTLVASEKSSTKFTAEAEVSFIIQDINDNEPLISLNSAANSPIKLREEEFTTLNQIFAINDIDQGNNAQFEVELENVDGAIRKIDYTEPFQVIPNNGYKTWQFAISVVQADLLDYDKTPAWREFSLKIQSKDKGVPIQNDDKIINIELQNLNDEIPVFSESINYVVKIREDAKADAYILNVLATDDDYDDHVKYTLAQEGNEYKLIPQVNESATLYTARDDVFDYERVKTVFIQITATDTLYITGEPEKYHEVNKQITVEVIDVNDETPIISLPNRISIEEHKNVGYLVTDGITAKDVDTKAHLKLTINWSKSSVSKLGVPSTNTSWFENVFAIETKFPDENAKGNAIGILTVNNKKTLDYEVFDTIYLNIQVEDLKQEIGLKTDEGTLTIIIVDINDHAPDFNMDTINSEKKVTEHSKIGFKIATIVATDKDGPEFNVVEYLLKPIKETKPGLVDIDRNTGELIVMSEKIDADCYEYIKFLHYDVIATDGELSSNVAIKIEVEDINEMPPYLKKPLDNQILVPERNSNDEPFFVQKVIGADCDRDRPHNVTNYEINNEITHLSDIFDMDPETGVINAKGNLEWDNDNEMKIYFIMKDNIGGNGIFNTEKFYFTIIVTDIDNNPPILPKPDAITITHPSEDTKIGEKIADIIATDKDKPCGDNTKIKYTIKSVKNSQDKDIPKDLFELQETQGPEPECKQIATLKIKSSLKGYYGKISITIHAQNPNTEENQSEETYEIIVEPVNYKPPKILSPADSILILKEAQIAGKKLQTIDEKYLADFEASDDQDEKFEMHFEPDPNTDWDDDFELIQKPEGQKNKARLTLTVKPSKKEYNLTIKAKHDGRGDQQNFVTKTITVKFVDQNQLPGFDTIEYQVEFWENETTIECQTFPPAKDPKCGTGEEDSCQYETHYHIINTEEKDYFKINSENGPQLCLVQWLDREKQPFHYLTIVANNDKLPPPKVPDGYEALVLTVKVLDINDNPPSFVSKLFIRGLSDSDKIDSDIVILNATDPDEVDQGKLRYRILKDTITVSDSSLDSIKNEAFEIVGNAIKNKRQPTTAMRGHFLFKVEVLDTLDYSDTAEVKIHIISDANRVIFIFEEDIDNVRAQHEAIEEIFSKEFGYSCTIDDFAKKINETDTRAVTYLTEVKTHFVDEKDEPIDKEVISVKLEDLTIVGRLRYGFEDIGLTLNGLDGDNGVANEVKNMEDLLLILLIVVSVVLGTLCIILIVAFILRSRSLNKRLAAMTTNVFGSTKSDLNRIGISAPGTNRHAIEANPVWNEDLNSVNQFDTMSQASGGSDLIGVEDRPDFASYDAGRPSINPVIQQNLKMKYDGDDYGANAPYDSDDNAAVATYGDDDDDIRSLPGSIKNTRTMF